MLKFDKSKIAKEEFHGTNKQKINKNWIFR